MASKKKRELPAFELEQELAAQGYAAIAGVDEVGRGCLCGPVVAAAVILPTDPNLYLPDGPLYGIRDSKQVPPIERVELDQVIRRHARAVGTGIMPPDLIDHMNIYHATRMAMMDALAELSLQPDYILLDAMKLPKVSQPQQSIIRGDAICTSIAAASIVAKVLRDSMMERMDLEFPGYGLAQHKGYATAQHIRALAELGPCPQHRRSFAPVSLAAMGLLTAADCSEEIAGE